MDMSQSKFDTYERLSLLSAIGTVLMTTGFYVIDCLLLHRMTAPTFFIRTAFLFIATFFYFIYNRIKRYESKRLILAFVPHMAFATSFISHLMTGHNETMTLSLMMLMFGFLASSLVLRVRDITTSAITLGGEILLALIFTRPPLLMVSAVFLYAGLAVSVALGYFIDLSYRQQYTAETKLRELSITDALTGCYNRKKITDLIVNGTNRLKGRYPISILMLDIDHFKNVNDTFGHEMGDEVLKYVALTARDCIREEDLLFRWGGEEFVILLINSRLEDAIPVAERIRKSVEEEHTGSVNHDIPVTISVGVAEYDGMSFDLSLKRSDEMMYKAKTGGRNRVEADYTNITTV